MKVKSKLIIVIVVFLCFGCQNTSRITDISSPDEKYKAILLHNKKDKDTVSLKIINTKINSQVMSDQKFYKREFFGTIDSDYPNRKWLTKSVFAIGMFESRNQMEQKLEIKNFVENDIAFLRISGFHNRTYVLDLKSNKSIQVPFFTEDMDNSKKAWIYFKVHFANQTKVNERFCVPINNEAKEFVLLINSKGIDFFSEQPVLYYQESCKKPF